MSKTKFHLILLIALLTCTTVDGQRLRDISNIRQQTVFETNKIYLVCRGTTSKSSLIAHQFNIADTNITHVGIGFNKNGKLNIYNVTDISHGRSALVLDSLESFIASPDVYYLSIWEFNSNPLEILRLKKICSDYYLRKIWFDAGFKINDDDSLYCSEFCAIVLKKLQNGLLNFKPRTIVLKNLLYEQILERKQMIYYPVDFFQQGNIFRKVFSYRFAK